MKLKIDIKEIFQIPTFKKKKIGMEDITHNVWNAKNFGFLED